MNVKKYFEQSANSPKVVPLAFYPSRKLLNLSMNDLLTNSDNQAACMFEMQKEFDPALIVRMTELWVEAEAFGAEIEITENWFPVIKNKVINDIYEIDDFKMRKINRNRIDVFIEGMEKAKTLIKYTPIISGVSAPFSLLSCLMDPQELMMACYTDAEIIHDYLSFITNFIIDYIGEYKRIGISGIMLAEPSISMISPEMAQEFSHSYVGKIISELQDDNFGVIYHNCGDVSRQLEGIEQLNAFAYHFGDAVSVENILNGFSENTIIMGNIHPAKFSENNADALRESIKKIRKLSLTNSNLILSSGCDISPSASISSIKLLFNSDY